MRFLELLPETNERSLPFLVQPVLGDSGENLPTVLKAICANPPSQGSSTFVVT